MKKLTFILPIVILFLFTACQKEDEKSDKEYLSYEINLKSFEPEVTVKGGGDGESYRKVIVEDLVKNSECKYEVVSGIIEFYLNEEMVFSVNFGNGACDGLASITWIKEDGSLHSKEVDVWRLFKKKEESGNGNKCFVLILPVEFQMPDGSIFTIAVKEDWRALRAWYTENPSYEEKPIMKYPVGIKFKDGEIRRVNNEDEMHRYKDACGEDYHGQQFTKVITEELIRSEECEGEIVSGFVDFYDHERNWVYSIDFGNGQCDGIATKCWINKETQEQECEDFDLREWRP